MSIIARSVILMTGRTLAVDRRWPDPADLICPTCRRPVRAEPPAMWKVADGPVPQWSRRDGEPLCLAQPCGHEPALPTCRRR